MFWKVLGPGHGLLSWVLLGMIFVGDPLWRSLAPRPMPVLRALAAVACVAGLCLMLACVHFAATSGVVPVAICELTLEAFGMVALALYAEIALALLDRWRHRSELLPEARSLRPRRGSRRPVERVLLGP
jgi:hypothetical protein